MAVELVGVNREPHPCICGHTQPSLPEENAA